jgi:S-formylglutathione hydrolase
MAGGGMKTLSENKCFGGVQGVYSHMSQACGGEMTFGLFLPKEASEEPVPVLWYLSGLTCTHENAMVKAGAQAWAAREGVALVFPDTSPRGPGVADDAAYDQPDDQIHCTRSLRRTPVPPDAGPRAGPYR